MVLEAWDKAKELWYPVVWEEVKEPSNVIGYGLNAEITKDTSAIDNANNQTTTGMANTIPWVNAPKLLSSTSITWDGEWGGWGGWWWGWWTLIWDTEISLALSEQAQWATHTAFNENTITSWWAEWSLDWYHIYPCPWAYTIAWMADTHNTNRTFTQIDIQVRRSWTSIKIWDEWNGKNVSYWSSSFIFEEWDDIRVYFTFSWTATDRISWWIRFIRFK